MWNSYDYSIGKLSVIYKDVDTRSERTLWQIEGNQGSGWKYGSVTFDITSFRYKVKKNALINVFTIKFITLGIISLV